MRFMGFATLAASAPAAFGLVLAATLSAAQAEEKT